MEHSEVVLTVTLAAVNLAVGFGRAVPIARMLAKAATKRQGFFRCYSSLLGVYFLECVAFAAGMATQVFSVGLAFVWAIAFGLWLWSRVADQYGVRVAMGVSLYSCAPTLSFCLILPVGWVIGGGNILSTTEGIAFGIPSFLIWPLTTILGFCGALAVGTIVMKTAITTGGVYLLYRLREHSVARVR